MAEIEIKFSGVFGYLAEGLELEQVCLLTNGGLHAVTYDRKGSTKAGSLIGEFDPLKDRLYTYSQIRRACQKARTEEKLYGRMSIVGPAGGMTRFGVQVGHMKPYTIHEMLEKLTFEGVDKAAVESAMILLYGEVNPA